jgi:hypothetical protein
LPLCGPHRAESRLLRRLVTRQEMQIYIMDVKAVMMMMMKLMKLLQQQLRKVLMQYMKRMKRNLKMTIQRRPCHFRGSINTSHLNHYPF